MVTKKKKIDHLAKAFRHAVYETSQDLSDFLRNSATAHSGCYFQYTTIDALKGMCKSNSLFLTQAKNLNDSNEMKAQEEDKARTYVASFSALRSESIAMWALYSTPAKKGIRIKFPTRMIKKLLSIARGEDKLFHVCNALDILKQRTLKNRLEVEEAYLTDVVYRGNNALTWRNKCVVGKSDLNQKINDDVLFAQVKDDLWRYEDEVRLIVKLKKSLGNYPKRIAIPVKSILRGMKIDFGPCFDETTEQAFIDEVKVTNRVEFKESVCTGKVRFSKTSPCEGCKRCTVRE